MRSSSSQQQQQRASQQQQQGAAAAGPSKASQAAHGRQPEGRFSGSELLLARPPAAAKPGPGC
eukprot:SAG25_NODE_3125_length_1207_cov_1.259928_1_plen_62_part_10